MWQKAAIICARGAHNLTPGTDLAHISLRARGTASLYLVSKKHLGEVYIRTQHGTNFIEGPYLCRHMGNKKEGDRVINGSCFGCVNSCQVLIQR